MWKLNQYWMWSAFAIWKEDIIWKDDKITFSWGNPDTRFIYSCFTMGWNAWLPWVFLLPCVETVLWKNLESPLLLTGYIYRHGPLGFEYIIYRHIHSPSIYTTQYIGKRQMSLFKLYFLTDETRTSTFYKGNTNLQVIYEVHQTCHKGLV